MTLTDSRTERQTDGQTEPLSHCIVSTRVGVYSSVQYPSLLLHLLHLTCTEEAYSLRHSPRSPPHPDANANGCRHVSRQSVISHHTLAPLARAADNEAKALILPLAPFLPCSSAQSGNPGTFRPYLTELIALSATTCPKCRTNEAQN